MNPEDLDRELERLWAKVSTPSSEGAASISPSPMDVESASYVHEASIEAIHLIKRQHREQAAQWEEMLALKEQALRETAQQLKRAEAELVDLRRDANVLDERLRVEMYDVAAKLEASRSALQEEQQRFRNEEKMLRELLDKARQQSAAEAGHWRDIERQWNEREQQYLSDLHEMQARLAKAEEETGRQQAQGRKQSEDLKEAKKAVEATLGELLNERRLREEADNDREKAHQRVVELTERLGQIQKTWDEERRQWQELWDRERSTWEVQRQEFSSWEERLRKEREAWHQQLQSKEEEVLRFSAQVSDTLRESSETSTKITQLLKTVSGPARGIWGPYVPKRMGKWLAAAAVSGILIASLWPAWKYISRPRFDLQTSHTLTLDNPTSVAFDGGALWVSEWSGRLVSLDPVNPSTVLARHSIVLTGAYHPASIAVGGGSLWSLDAAQGRVLKHAAADPTIVQGSWVTPGPAPVAIAHDGQNLWSYDAVTKSIYRHLGEGPKAEAVAYLSGTDMVPTSLMWMGDELWIHDSKGKRVLRFVLSDKGLRIIDSLPCNPKTLSMAAYRIFEGKNDRRIVWELGESSRDRFGYSLRKYRVRSIFDKLIRGR